MIGYWKDMEKWSSWFDVPEIILMKEKRTITPSTKRTEKLHLRRNQCERLLDFFYDGFGAENILCASQLVFIQPNGDLRVFHI